MISTKSQAPAFAEAASRRQAKSQTSSNEPNSKFKTQLFRSFEIEVWDLFGIWDLEFGI
jgi:hypothetical protein